MEDLPDGLNRLENRLDALERRVYALEHPAEAMSSVAALQPSPQVATESDSEPSASEAVGTFSVLGKAMLGIAGAYLLRALADSNVLPNAVVAAVAIAYALAWLVWASRAKTGDWLTGTVYSCTSALILAPMLWELVLRFNVLAAPVAAAIVAGFAVAVSVLAWKRELSPVLWVGNLTAAAISLALSIASHHMIPFIGTLLLMVLISEFGAARGRESGVRILVSLAADAAVWALIFIYTSQEGMRASYPPLGAAALIAPGLILFVIFGASVVYKTVLVAKQITVFETMQTMATFLLAACSLIYFGPPGSGTGFGFLCLVLSGVGYVTTLTRFKRAEERRNLLVFANWSAALMLAGSVMSMPAKAQIVWLSMCAVAASWVGARTLRLHLQLHGLVFLVVAAAGAGFMAWVAEALAGAMPGAAGLAVYLIMVCAIACYAAVALNRGEGWKQQGLALVFALLTMSAVAAFIVHGLMSLIALKVIPGAHHLAFIRTLTICLVAIGLEFGGARWGRGELTKIGYATLALLALKLAVEDLRNGQLAYIAGSIFLFAITLIVVPRVARMGQKVHHVRLVKS